MTLFVAFAMTLCGIAIFHKHNLRIALMGLVTILVIRWHIGFGNQTGLTGILHHASHEWVNVSNVFLLICGFEIVSQYFAASGLPLVIPRILPDDWKGGAVLLGIIWGGSIFLDNIAAAMIGGMIATSVYKGIVGVGFVAAIVAVANAGGAFSVIGDTTTTMQWISGVRAEEVLPAIIGSITALFVIGVFAAKQQQALHPIMKDPPLDHHKLDLASLTIVFLILAGAATTNMIVNSKYKQNANALPWIGIAVWCGIIASTMVKAPHWSSLRGASKSAMFLSALILSASMMPIETLPKASVLVTFGLGVLSSVFDNIPLTALAIKQGGYNPALLAYSVGFGGSITWFGSSAGVAICNEFPSARSIKEWIKQGWFIIPAYVAGFLAICGYYLLF